MAGKVLAVMQCGILVGQVKPVRIEEFLAVNDMKIIGRHLVRTSPVAASSDPTVSVRRSPDWIKVKNPDAPAVTRA